MAQPEFAATYVPFTMYLVSERDKSICVADAPGVKTCWQGTWIGKGALLNGTFDLVNAETGEIEFMIKKGVAKKIGLLKGNRR